MPLPVLLRPVVPDNPLIVPEVVERLPPLMVVAGRVPPVTSTVPVPTKLIEDVLLMLPPAPRFRSAPESIVVEPV